MKKITLLVLVLFASVVAMEASAQTTSTKTTTTRTTTSYSYRYYYYPEANVYFNTESGEYWIYEEPETKWKVTKTLPTSIVVKKSPRYIIRYDNAEPWKENTEHIKKFKVKKNGEVKIKMEKDDN